MPRIYSTLLFLCLFSATLLAQNRQLQLDLNGFEPVHYHSLSTQTIVQEMPQSMDTIKQRMELWYHFELKNHTDSTITLGLVYDQMHFSMQTPLFAYDSTRDSVSPPDSRAAGYQALLGTQLFLTISRSGKILNIEGLERAREVILENLSKNQDISNIDITNIPFLNEEELKTGLSQLFTPFPEHPVTIDDTWNRSSTFKSDYDLTYEDAFKLVEIQDSIDVLQINSYIYTPEKGFFTSKNGLEIRLKLKGEQSGLIKLDSQTGFVQSLEISQTILGTGDTIVESRQLDWPIMVSGATLITRKPSPQTE